MKTIYKVKTTNIITKQTTLLFVCEKQKDAKYLVVKFNNMYRAQRINKVAWYDSCVMYEEL